MKTIGQILQKERVDKEMTLGDLEKITKIRASFIELIEEEKWEQLPPFPTVLGFVKSISWAVGLDRKMAVAVLKRDYPPQKLKISPKPDVKNKVLWSPKLTFLLGVTFVLMCLFGYLGYQYYKFVSPPRLRVESPKEEQIIVGDSVNVFGSTDSDAKIEVNDQPVTVSDDGKFSVSLSVAPETREVIVKASSRSGKSTTVSRKIQTVQKP
jgi:cytoskeletal protein RodZ